MRAGQVGRVGMPKPSMSYLETLTGPRPVRPIALKPLKSRNTTYNQSEANPQRFKKATLSPLNNPTVPKTTINRNLPTYSYGDRSPAMILAKLYRPVDAERSRLGNHNYHNA